MKKEGGNLNFDWKALVVLAGFGSVVILLMKHYKYEKLEKIDQTMIRSYGTPSLGGDFELCDHEGNMRTNKDFLGKWIILYFGFTNCPDICPEELEKMVNAVEIVNRHEGTVGVQPVFISIDPERDTAEAVKTYLEDFSDQIIGLTGTDEQVNAATRAFRVYYSKGPKDEDDDYLVDHSIIMYLLNDRGEFCEYFGQVKSAGEIASSILDHMGTSGVKKTTKKKKKKKAE